MQTATSVNCASADSVGMSHRSFWHIDLPLPPKAATMGSILVQLLAAGRAAAAEAAGSRILSVAMLTVPREGQKAKHVLHSAGFARERQDVNV